MNLKKIKDGKNIRYSTNGGTDLSFWKNFDKFKDKAIASYPVGTRITFSGDALDMVIDWERKNANRFKKATLEEGPLSAVKTEEGWKDTDSKSGATYSDDEYASFIQRYFSSEDPYLYEGTTLEVEIALP